MHATTVLGTMGFATGQRHDKFWKVARFGAFVCYIAACGLLGISLVLAKSDNAIKGAAPIAGAAASDH